MSVIRQSNPDEPDAAADREDPQKRERGTDESDRNGRAHDQKPFVKRFARFASMVLT